MRIAIILAAIAGLAVAAAACGGVETVPPTQTPLASPSPGPTGSPATPTPSPTATPPSELAPQPEVVQALVDEVSEPDNGVITVEIADFIYVQNNLRVPLSDTVTIRAINIGEVAHNLRVAGADGRYRTDDDFVTAETGQLPGETAEFQFTPTIPGTYVFRCDFHPTEEGGVIVVE
jgi:plastocyanin